MEKASKPKREQQYVNSQDTMICPECKNQNSLRVCYQEGEKVCTSCGYVVEKRFIDQTAEWRNFGDGSSDVSRAGAKVSEFDEDGGLGTGIAGKSKFDPLQKQQAQKEKGINQYNKKIQNWGYTLDLDKSLVKKAQETFEQIRKTQSFKGKKIEAIIGAVLYYVASQNNQVLSFEKIENATQIQKAEIVHYNQIVQKWIPKYQYVKPKTFIENFAVKLNLTHDVIAFAQEVVNVFNKHNVGDGKNPRTVASAALYEASTKFNLNITLKQITELAEIAENTVKSFQKEYQGQRQYYLNKMWTN